MYMVSSTYLYKTGTVPQDRKGATGSEECELLNTCHTWLRRYI